MNDNYQATAREKALNVALAFLLAASGILAALVSGTTQKAHAAETASLTVGGSIYYAGWGTSWFSVDGEMAYCGNPSASTPGSGTYEKQALSAPSGRSAETAADLWFGYGSPGFDASLFPATWYDGTAMTDARYAALTHILVSDTFSSNGDYALYGCSETFKSWCRQNVIGFGTDGAEINPNATGRKMCARMGEVPANFNAFMLYTGGATQLILSFSYVPNGSVELTKTSAIESTSMDNSCYSLAGAEYTVYADAGCTNHAATIATDASGYGRADGLAPGAYWVKETKAATGYALDERTYSVEVRSNETTPVNGGTVSDIPQSDPVGILLAKVDATTGKSDPQGAGTLAGAQFTLDFYGGSFASAEAAEASGEPLDTWVFETDEDGFAYLDDAYKVSGGELYRMSNGDATLPIGTAVIYETKAPVGYNLDDGFGNAPAHHCVQITGEGDAEAIYTYNSFDGPDTVVRGDFRLVKEVATTVYSEGDGDMPQDTLRVLVEGVRFELVNDTENSIVSPETGEEVAPGEVVCTITTDENGLASTKNGADVNGWDIPQGWSAALAFGTYTVHEVIPEEVAEAFHAKYGAELLAVDDWKVTISEEGQYDAPVLVNDRIPQTPLKVVKVDAETGVQIPLACSFQLFDEDGELVTYTARYPETQVMDTWTTNGKGEVTLPMLLEEGTYTLREVLAPEGYVLAPEDATIEVGAVYNGWDDPVTVKFADMPQKATITVSKHDSTNGEPVADSVYNVVAATDIATGDGTVRAHAGDIVATLETDEDGCATTPELYLGTYTVYEAKAQDGYSLNVDEETVELAYQGQDVAVFDVVLDVEDVPTQIGIHKVDALNEEVPVAGAVFRIWNDAGTFDEELTTDAEGMITLSHVKHGSYHVQEIAAPEGYVVYDVDEEGNAAVHDFKVNDQGFVEAEGSGDMCASFTWTVRNMPKTMGTTATDTESEAHEGQARKAMQILDVIDYTGCIPGDEYTVSGVLMDAENGAAVLDVDGNEITAETTFIAEDFCGSVEVAFTFDGSLLAGRALVAFETMYFEDEVYMVHADLTDEGQTVRVVDIHTQATNPATGDNTAETAERLDLVDKVGFEGLTPGATYKLFTSIYDRATGNALEGADGTPLVFETTFVPEAPNGEIEVPVTIDAADLAGTTMVFFEKLADADDAVIATHEDIDDDGQSIVFNEGEDGGKGYPKTGGNVPVAPIAASAAVVIGCGAAGAAYAAHKRRVAKAETEALQEEVAEE